MGDKERKKKFRKRITKERETEIQKVRRVYKDNHSFCEATKRVKELLTLQLLLAVKSGDEEDLVSMLGTSRVVKWFMPGGTTETVTIF